MRRNLNGMVVVITGASSGIGRALAEELSARGAQLALAARRVDRLEELNRALGGKHLVVKADVSVTEDCRALIEQAIARFGRIDTLVCNAGYGFVRPVAKMSHEETLRIFQTNVLGTTDCVQAAVPHMRKQEVRDGVRGQIVIVSSAAARRGLPYFGAYSATKAAQLSLAEALRVELKPAGIAVTSVHPVGTATDFFTTAESVSKVRMPPRTLVEARQTAATVARKMVRGIERPRPEVWPFAPVRWAFALAVLMPGSVDRVMSKHRRALAGQEDSGESKA